MQSRARRIARMVRALHFYANASNYDRANADVFRSQVDRDRGKIARRALAIVDDEITAQVPRRGNGNI